jgi:hypothetical protein
MNNNIHSQHAAHVLKINFDAVPPVFKNVTGLKPSNADYVTKYYPHLVTLHYSNVMWMCSTVAMHRYRWN